MVKYHEQKLIRVKGTCLEGVLDRSPVTEKIKLSA